MPSLNKIIYQVLDTANKGQTNRAHEIGERLVARWVLKYNNLLNAQDIVKTGNVDNSIETDLGCLTLTEGDASFCDAYCWGESVYYVDLPQLLNTPNNMSLTYAGLVSKQDRINVSEYNYGRYNDYSRFAPKKIYGSFIGNRLVLYNVDPVFAIEGINVRGVFEDVTNLVTASSPTNPIKCFDWDKDSFPVLANKEAALIDLIYQKELGILRTAVTDKKADDTSAEAM